MKFAVVFVAIFGVAIAIDLGLGPPIILQYVKKIDTEGYKYEWVTTDGKFAAEEGHLKNVGTDHEAISVKGYFSYVGDNGVYYKVTYVADENGFQPTGDHLPG